MPVTFRYGFAMGIIFGILFGFAFKKPRYIIQFPLLGTFFFGFGTCIPEFNLLYKIYFIMTCIEISLL